MAGLEQHTETLARQFTDQDRLETSQKHSHLNALKMGVWIVVELMKCFEEQAKGVHIVTAKVIISQTLATCVNVLTTSKHCIRDRP